MHNICFFLLGAQVQYVMTFKTEESAGAAHASVIEAMEAGEVFTKIADDYGQTLTLPTSQIASVYVEDVTQACWIQIDKEIIKRTVDADFLKKREEDMNLIRLFPRQGGVQGGHA